MKIELLWLASEHIIDHHCTNTYSRKVLTISRTIFLLWFLFTNFSLVIYLKLYKGRIIFVRIKPQTQSFIWGGCEIRLRGRPVRIQKFEAVNSIWL